MRAFTNRGKWSGGDFKGSAAEPITTGSGGEDLITDTVGEWEHHNGFIGVGSGGRGIILPVTGLWLIQGAVQFGASGAGTWRGLQFWKNGAAYAQGYTGPQRTSAGVNIIGALLVDRFVKDDEIDIHVFQNTGANLDAEIADSGVSAIFLGHY